jgi:hypothetical protein
MISAFQHPYAEANISRIRTTEAPVVLLLYDNEQVVENLHDDPDRVKITGPPLWG